MNLKQLLIIASLVTAVCWLIWFIVLFQTDPLASDWPNFVLFYASLFLSLFGSFFLLSFLWRKLFNKFSLEYRLVGTSFRQSFFISILVVGVLLLASRDLLTWWNTILLIVAVGLVEFCFLSCRRIA